jgi:hypothetical protein
MEEKIARICWNSLGWKKPSGTYGKSSNRESFENETGYGHEEWLFDDSKIINGYHYGFLQPVNSLNKKTDKHRNQEYKIWLYSSLNGTEKLIGCINKAICISKEESIEIHKNYKENKFLQKMEDDLFEAGINTKQFKETPPEIFFNVKFKFSDAEIYSVYPIISKDNKVISAKYYTLLNKKLDFKFENYQQKNTDIFSRAGYEGGDINPYHNKIQNALLNLLNASGIYKNLKLEKNRIDMEAILKNGDVHFFEVKTDTPKYNIRQAIGQLMEYSFYPNTIKAKKMFIVGDAEPNADIICYMKHLREITLLNIFYIWVDMNNKKISKEY